MSSSFKKYEALGRKRRRIDENCLLTAHLVRRRQNGLRLGKKGEGRCAAAGARLTPAHFHLGYIMSRYHTKGEGDCAEYHHRCDAAAEGERGEEIIVVVCLGLFSAANARRCTAAGKPPARVRAKSVEGFHPFLTEPTHRV